MEVAWSVYQKMISANRHTDLAKGKRLMSRLIGKIATGVPAGIEEIARLGRTLKRRREDVLAYFDHPGSSNGPTEALNGRLEHLRGIAQGSRNLTHYTARSLWSAWCFSDWGSFSSRESIGWRPCQQRNTQMSSRPKWCVR